MAFVARSASMQASGPAALEVVVQESPQESRGQLNVETYALKDALGQERSESFEERGVRRVGDRFEGGRVGGASVCVRMLQQSRLGCPRQCHVGQANKGDAVRPHQRGNGSRQRLHGRAGVEV